MILSVWFDSTDLIYQNERMMEEIPLDGMKQRFQAHNTLPLLDSILRLGNCYELDFPEVQAKNIIADLQHFSDQWQQYNPYKPGIPRYGLSLTSLDGKMGGRPDLYSLQEFHRREGVLYRESDFRCLTSVYEGCPSIHPFVDYFSPFLGRSHFLRIDAGGFFPPHRDSALMAEPDCIRILVPISNVSLETHAFLYDGNRIRFEAGKVYFLNTMISHSIFSFSNSVVYLICNLILTPESVKRFKLRLLER
jgi:hypothetical protein